MSKPFSPEKFWEYYDLLPPELQEALFSKEISEKIKKISRIYDFKIEETGKLSSLVGLVLLGCLHPNEFEKELEKELPEEKEYIKDIAHDVWRLIFFPLKGPLSSIYKIEEKKIFKEAPKIEIEKEKEKLEKKERSNTIEKEIKSFEGELKIE